VQRVNPILALVIVALVLVSILIVYSYSGGTLRVPATTTTSLYATGLLDALADKYREDTGANVEFQFIAVGSGEALRRAAQGDACMVFVHAPSLEIEYIREGILVDGRIFAYNYFIIVGPPEDPANVREAESAVDAFLPPNLRGGRTGQSHLRVPRRQLGDPCKGALHLGDGRPRPARKALV